jgi:hypothetical protein
MTTLCRRTTSALLLALVLVAGLTAPATTARAEHSQGTLYLPEVANDTIAVLDIATDTIVRRIPIDGEATRPAVMAATADGRKLYVDNFGVLPATVTVIDRPSGSTKNIRTSSVPLGAFISNDSRELFLPESGFEIEVLDTATDRIVRKFHFPDIRRFCRRRNRCIRSADRSPTAPDDLLRWARPVLVHLHQGRRQALHRHGQLDRRDRPAQLETNQNCSDHGASIHDAPRSRCVYLNTVAGRKQALCDVVRRHRCQSPGYHDRSHHRNNPHRWRDHRGHLQPGWDARVYQRPRPDHRTHAYTGR